VLAGVPSGPKAAAAAGHIGAASRAQRAPGFGRRFNIHVFIMYFSIKDPITRLDPVYP
jgi:hypothetical protein